MDLVTHPFWVRLQRLASGPDSGVRNLWAQLRAKLDLASYRPEAAPDVIVGELVGRDGPYYILKSLSGKTYYRLGARDHFLWERMDGSQSVKDLVVAYFMQFGAFAFGRVAQLVSALKAGHFLTDKPVSVYRRAQEQVESRRMSFRLMRAANGVIQHQFAIGGLDWLVGGLYRRGGFLLFTRPMQLLYALLSIAGIYCFSIALRGGYSLVTTASGSYLPGLVILLALQLLSILIHELAHALTIKHYGREVYKAGVTLNFGLPGFFVDTNDIWLEGKRARLAVSWAGPYSGLVLAGMASIALAVWSDLALSSILFRFASVSYLLVFLNLNPLLKLDGYYLLMDWLEIPMLRTKSLHFLRTGLPAKIQQLREASTARATGLGWLRGLELSREQRIYTLFGVLSALWTLYAIYLGASFWQSRLSAAVSDLFARQQGALDYLLAGLVVLVSAAFLLLMLLYPLRLLLGAVRSAAERGLLANLWRVAALALVLVSGLALIPFLSPSPIAGQVVGLAALLAALVVAIRSISSYAGSRVAPVSALLGLAALAWLVSHILGMVMAGAVSWPAGQAAVQGLELAALLVLCAAAALLLAATGLRRLWIGVWVLGVLASVAGAGLALYSGVGQAQLGLEGELILVIQILLPALGLGLLAPSLLAFWRTVSGPAWTALALACGWLIAAPLLELSLVPAYLLLACALALHNLALSQLRFGGERRAVTVDLDDGRRLRRAFVWTMEGVLRQVSEVAGEWQARLMAGSFTEYADAAHWPVRLAPSGAAGASVIDRAPDGRSLIEQGETYAAALNLLLELVTSTIGARLTRRTLQGAYDDLPWEEREIANQYLFAHIDLARALSREFKAIHRDYAALVSRVPIFATMSREEIELLLGRLRLERHPAGKRIVRQGDSGERFYIVRQGHVEVTQRDAAGVTRVVNQLNRGDYFGELALLRDAPRNATCRAAVPTETLALSRKDFDELVRNRFAIQGKLDRSLARAELLRRLPLFAELDGLQIQQVVAQLHQEHLDAGTVFIQQGEIGETFCIIEKGRVQVFVTENGQERVVAERGPGEYVGEIALLLDVPRTASVRALTPAELLTLSRQDFDRLVQSELHVSQRLERETSRRMSDLARLDSAGA